MKRSIQIILIGSALAGSWLGMLACHEFGHVLHAWLSGGTVTAVDLPLLGFSQTHVSPNPHPQFTAWGGAIWGSLLPLALWATCRLSLRESTRFRRAKADDGSAATRSPPSPYAFLAAFFAGFCLLVNGVYLAAGSFVGAASDADDAHELLRHGAARWQLVAFGVTAAAAGLRMWHGLGPVFGLQRPGGEVDRKAAIVAAGLLVGWIVVFLIVGAVAR